MLNKRWKMVIYNRYLWRFKEMENKRLRRMHKSKCKKNLMLWNWQCVLPPEEVRPITDVGVKRKFTRGGKVVTRSAGLKPKDRQSYRRLEEIVESGQVCFL